ncbi:cell division protein FtsQ/DivIB [Fundicoccus culcitae]|uniref:Cell division protein DivIB n=1 Tax=Fundicoccus culcitae TaxID=2969821 RepID=A0ABY5P5I7_9LACT|nr:hypothetical protein [Fundicoccus culcitae]UUX34007.1 hypothetical protein NRE15_14165 [Fundicoccus culcitae]
MPNYRIDSENSNHQEADEDLLEYEEDYRYSGNYRIDDETSKQVSRRQQREQSKPFNHHRPRKQANIYQYSDYYQWDDHSPNRTQNKVDRPVRSTNTYADYPSPYENQPLMKWYHRLQYRLLMQSESQNSQLPRGRLKLLSIVVIIYLVMLVTAWQLMPFNKVNQLVVSGNQLVDANQLAMSTGIRDYDLVDEVISRRQTIETNMIENFPVVESIVFKRDNWDQLEIVVNEHHVVATMGEGDTQQFILENGESIYAASGSNLASINANQLPRLINFSDDQQITDLSKILRQIEPEILAMISTITPSTDANKPNGIEVVMKDGNLVKAIIVTFAQKMNHYPEMLNQIGNTSGIINLEVGAYFVPTAANANSIKLDSQ